MSRAWLRLRTAPRQWLHVLAALWTVAIAGLAARRAPDGGGAGRDPLRARLRRAGDACGDHCTSRWLYPGYRIDTRAAVYAAVLNLTARWPGNRISAPILVRPADAIESLAARDEPTLIASVHYPIPVVLLALTRALPERRFVVLAGYPGQASVHCRQLGLDPGVDVTYLRNDALCLARLRRLRAPGLVVICNADHPSTPVAGYDSVGPNLFAAARLLQFRLVFSRPTAHPDGSFHVCLQEQPLDRSATGLAAAFIDYHRPDRELVLARKPADARRQPLLANGS